MWFEYVKIAVKVLRAHKFRSSLTMLSIAIGAFSIVVMTSLAKSGLDTLKKGFYEIGGANIIFVFPKRAEKREDKSSLSSGYITSSDRTALFSSVPHLGAKTVVASLDEREFRNRLGQIHRADLVATDDGFFESMALPRAKGRLFNKDDLDQHAKVCVIGEPVAQALWQGNAIGQILSFDGMSCRIVGQIAQKNRKGMNLGFDWANVVAIPIETYMDRHPNVERGSWVYLRTHDPRHNDEVKRSVNTVLKQRHHGVDDIELMDFASFVEKFEGVFLIMKVIVGLLAGIALFVGGIGVMNMMLVSVSERVREIGIRKSLGAPPTAIVAQFIYESIMLSGLGGTIGIAFGLLITGVATMVISHLQPEWVGTIAYGGVTAALLVSIGVGVVFGYVPARRASRLDPVIALRT